MLKLLKNGEQSETPIISPISQDLSAEAHHRELLERYYQSHRVRGHAATTIADKKRIVEGWFNQYAIYGSTLYTWEAMVPVEGRKRMLDYSKGLIESDIATKTIRHYLGTLDQYFSFVLEFPYVEYEGRSTRIQDIYGSIEKPLGEFDLPVHVGDAEIPVPIEPEKIYDFLALLRANYLKEAKHVRARNYTMAVVAVQSGLRADELVHLEMKDLMFDSLRLQTRFAKGKEGTGKRSRLTLFPPLARDTVKFYLSRYRPLFPRSDKSDLLFLSHTGRLIDSSTLSRIMKEMVDVAVKGGMSILPHMSWHWARRIFATLFIERFPDKLHILLELLGHSSMSTIHRYIRHSRAWMDSEIKSVLQRVEKCPLIGD